LCPHIYGADDLWHSHTGKFMRVENNIKRLINLNIDCLDERDASGEDQRAVKIATVITDSFNQPDYDATSIEPQSVENFVDEHMDKLHKFSKQTLAGIICDDMCKRIGLFE